MKRWTVVLFLSLLAAFAHISLLVTPLGDLFEYAGSDLWYSVRGPVPAPNDIVIVSMDEASYRVLNLPMDKAWPRSVHAKLLKRLADYKVRRVVMDILFLGEGADPDADRDFWEGLQSVKTVLGADTGVREQGAAGSHYTIEELLTPYEPFAEAAEKIALVKMPEEEGFVRRFVIPRSHLTKELPTLYEAAVGIPHTLPWLPDERDLVWYYGQPGVITTLPYHQIIDSSNPLPDHILKDKIVFVGLNLRTGTGPMQKDTFKIPFHHLAMFGMEIQATAAANMLEKKWVKRASATREAAWLFVVTLILVFAMFSVKPQWGALLIVSAALLWAVISYKAFLHGIFVPGVILNCLVLPFMYLASTLTYYVITYRAQQHVEKAFQLYLPPQMAKQMRANTSSLELGGEDVRATALFTDIEGFTQITETMSAPQVSAMLNSYFTEVVKVVFDKQGTLIKFIGDAVFVIWGAPLKLENPELLACEAALAIQEEVNRFNALERFPPLHTRIGIHTGSMVVGNLGSDRRFDFTAVGDAVNLASRLEGLNKYFGSAILVSESTRLSITAPLDFFPLGFIRAAGKKDLTKIYALFKTSPSPEGITLWEVAYGQFKERRWEEASKSFKLAGSAAPLLAKAALFYDDQSVKNQTDEPPESWGGEIIFSGK